MLKREHGKLKRQATSSGADPDSKQMDAPPSAGGPEAPKELDELIRAIAFQTPDHIVVQDLQLRYVWVINPQLGLTQEDMIGRTDDDIVPHDEAQRLRTTKQQALNTRRTIPFETSLRAKSGTLEYFEGNYVPWVTPSGELKGLIGYFHNVTRRHEAETGYKTASLDLDESQRIARIGTYRFDIESMVWTSTKTLDDIFGLPPHFVKKGIESWERLLHADDRDEIIRFFTEDVLGHGVAFDREYRVVRPVDGREVWVHGLGKVERGPQGEAVSMLGTVQDITERKRTEAKLRVSEERFRLAQKATNDVIWDWDARSDARTWNKNGGEVFGWRFDTIQQNTRDWWTDRIHPEDRGRVVTQFNSCMADTGLEVWTDEYRFLKSDGSYAEVEDRAYAVRDSVGNVLRVVGAMHDVSNTKRVEQALKKANEQLRDGERRKDDFLAILSHELRNPLAPIRHSLDVLERTVNTHGMAGRSLAVLGRQVEHLTHMVDDLLDVTRIARGKLALDLAPLDLREAVRNAAADHQHLFTQRGIQLRVQPAAEELWIQGDETRISEVIGNLLSNAAKFTPYGGSTRISTQKDPRKQNAVLRVQDSGPGIPLDLLPHLFEPFTQADRSLDRKSGGLGLGLYVVKGLIELHGGTVQATRNSAGSGTTFTVSLPLRPMPPKTSMEPGATMTTREKRILIIEDNVDAAELLRDALSLIGYSADIAFTGSAGIDKALRTRPDVVLCDIGLPEVDGYEVARALSGRSELAHTRLIAMSGYAGADDVARAIASGFHRHLAKPASLKVLEQELRAS